MNMARDEEALPPVLTTAPLGIVEAAVLVIMQSVSAGSDKDLQREWHREPIVAGISIGTLLTVLDNICQFSGVLPAFGIFFQPRFGKVGCK